MLDTILGTGDTARDSTEEDPKFLGFPNKQGHKASNRSGAE